MAEKQAKSDTGLGSGGVQGASSERSHLADLDLHLCPACSSELVQPLDWAPMPERRWRLLRRCPDCEWRDEGVFAQAVLDRFDEALDLATEMLLDDLSLLTRANMEEQVERFAAALHADQIVPEDF